MRKSSKTLVALLLAMMLIVAGCGRDDDDEGGASGGGDTGGDDSSQEVKTGPGVDATSITLGVLTPLSGRVALIGKPLTNGNEVFWKAYNERNGGVGGKYQVKLLSEDTVFDAPTAIQKYTKIKGSVAAFNQILGTAVNKAILAQLKTDKIGASPATLDADWVREPNLFPIGGPYQTQAINSADYYINKMNGKGKKICFMGLNDAYGDAGLSGLKFAADKLDFDIASEVRYKQGDTDFTAQITQLKNAQCDMVFATVLADATKTIVESASQLGFTPQWIGQSPSWLGLWATSVPMQQHYMVVAEGTEWGDTSVEGMKQMIDDQKKYAPDQAPDIYFVFGYYQSWLMSQILEQAVKDGDLTQQGIINASQKLGTLTFGGLTGDYEYGEASDRTPPSASTFYKVDAAVPGGLKKVEYNYESELAKDYEY